jgi:hypothetical protein
MRRDSFSLVPALRAAAPFVLGLLGAVCSAAPLQAQAKTDTVMDGAWHFGVMPYFWAAGIDGTLSVTGANEVPVKASFSDILSNFDFGLLGHFEARKNRFGFAVDEMYLNLGADVPTARPILGILDLGADVKQLVTEGFVFYRAVHGGRGGAGYLDVLAGLRYDGTSTGLTLSGPGGTSIGGTKRTFGWVDAIGGARFRVPLGSRAGLTGRGDLGTFGSDLTWNVRGGLDVRLGERWSAGADYRVMDIDYDKGEGLQRRIYKTRYSGPNVWGCYSW